jgi:hypothetical protein
MDGKTNISLLNDVMTLLMKRYHCYVIVKLMLFNDEMPLLAIVIVLAIFVAFMSVLMLLFMSLINKLLNCSVVHLLRVRFVRFGGSAD